MEQGIRKNKNQTGWKKYKMDSNVMGLRKPKEALTVFLGWQPLPILLLSPHYLSIPSLAQTMQQKLYIFLTVLASLLGFSTHFKKLKTFAKFCLA